MTATRFMSGAICMSKSSHLPLRLYSNNMKPVALPLGRARLLTKPEPSGSVTIVNTMGTVRVDRSRWSVGALPKATRTSGVNATSSVAYLRRTSAFPPAARMSVRTLRLSVQPSRGSSCNNGSIRTLFSVSSRAVSMPMRRTRWSCAFATSGQAAVPPRSLMNSRRLTACPRVSQGRPSYRNKGQCRKGQCPIWVISGHFAVQSPCPLYPQNRTLMGASNMFATLNKPPKSPVAGAAS